jgi:hypothetical protein
MPPRRLPWQRALPFIALFGSDPWPTYVTFTSLRRLQDYTVGVPLQCLITAYADRTFTYKINTPPVSYFLKNAAQIKSVSCRLPRSRCRGAIVGGPVRTPW